ncbi:hypothetical protein K469DRAFT_547467 [Zopfia rhizophila CBS 207.26]|uniref:Conidiation protein 6 n=1 Tax=Zopfia rhizophila CBS 207.26 TaxID=1314779 RepID=A0A6A6EU37_9PEZI|nr:hypothetical protein K469DRAFT_547467 [Zopfia rhizophila CBS 207.26]
MVYYNFARTGENPDIVSGHKANLNNSNTSKESQHSYEVLGQEFNGGNIESHSSEGKNSGNVAGGLKATMNNPDISEEVK